MNNTTLKKEELKSMQEDLFKIESLAKVLKLASGTSYVQQIDDEDIAVISDVIIGISNKLSIEISEHL